VERNGREWRGLDRIGNAGADRKGRDRIGRDRNGKATLQLLRTKEQQPNEQELKNSTQ
jgi:hypothetical protein